MASIGGIDLVARQWRILQFFSANGLLDDAGCDCDGCIMFSRAFFARSLPNPSLAHAAATLQLLTAAPEDAARMRREQSAASQPRGA